MIKVTLNNQSIGRMYDCLTLSRGKKVIRRLLDPIISAIDQIKSNFNVLSAERQIQMPFVKQPHRKQFNFNYAKRVKRVFKN